MTRRCGECTLCCKVMPVGQIGKPANTRCQHLRAKGCTVHSMARYPSSCSLWQCVWLQQPDADLPRPDRAHYVIDPYLDYIELAYRGERERLDVVQVWVDPKHPNAHRDPKLRAYLADRAERVHQAGLVRFDEVRALALFAPAFTTGGWIEVEHMCLGRQHTVAEIYRRRIR